MEVKKQYLVSGVKIYKNFKYRRKRILRSVTVISVWTS